MPQLVLRLLAAQVARQIDIPSQPQRAALTALRALLITRSRKKRLVSLRTYRSLNRNQIHIL